MNQNPMLNEANLRTHDTAGDGACLYWAVGGTPCRPSHVPPEVVLSPEALPAEEDLTQTASGKRLESTQSSIRKRTCDFCIVCERESDSWAAPPCASLCNEQARLQKDMLVLDGDSHEGEIMNSMSNADAQSMAGELVSLDELLLHATFAHEDVDDDTLSLREADDLSDYNDHYVADSDWYNGYRDGTFMDDLASSPKAEQVRVCEFVRRPGGGATASWRCLA